MDNIYNLNLQQLKNLKLKEKDDKKKNKIINVINIIIKKSQIKWHPEDLIFNDKNIDNDNTSINSTISTLSTLSTLSLETNKKNIKSRQDLFTNYDISKYYNKVSNKKDDNDEICNRILNHAKFMNKKQVHIVKPYQEGEKKVLGKRRYIF